MRLGPFVPALLGEPCPLGPKWESGPGQPTGAARKPELRC